MIVTSTTATALMTQSWCNAQACTLSLSSDGDTCSSFFLLCVINTGSQLSGLGLWCTLPTVCSPGHRPPGSQRGWGPGCRLKSGKDRLNNSFFGTSRCIDSWLSLCKSTHSAPLSVLRILPVGKGPTPYWLQCFTLWFLCYLPQSAF